GLSNPGRKNARSGPDDEGWPRPRGASRGGRAARGHSCRRLHAVGVVLAIGGGVRFLGGVLRLLGRIGGLLGGVGEVLATGHVVARAVHLAGDLGRRVGRGVRGVGGGLGGRGGGGVTGGVRIVRGLAGLGGRVGGLLGGVGGLVLVRAGGEAGNEGEGEKGLGSIHGISVPARLCAVGGHNARGPVAAARRSPASRDRVQIPISQSMSRKLRSCSERDGWRSLRSALASIWRI